MKYRNATLTENVFMTSGTGLDNFYIGTVYTMYHLISYFYIKLDSLLLKYPAIGNQEQLVYLANKDIFHLLLQMLDFLVIIISTPHEKQQQTSRRKRGFALTIIITGRKIA